MGADALLFGSFKGSIKVLQNLYHMGSAMFLQGLCKGSVRCSSRGLGC